MIKMTRIAIIQMTEELKIQAKSWSKSNEIWLMENPKKDDDKNYPNKLNMVRENFYSIKFLIWFYTWVMFNNLGYDDHKLYKNLIKFRPSLTEIPLSYAPRLVGISFLFIFFSFFLLPVLFVCLFIRRYIPVASSEKKIHIHYTSIHGSKANIQTSLTVLLCYYYHHHHH